MADKHVLMEDVDGNHVYPESRMKDVVNLEATIESLRRMSGGASSVSGIGRSSVKFTWPLGNMSDEEYVTGLLISINAVNNIPRPRVLCVVGIPHKNLNYYTIYVSDSGSGSASLSSDHSYIQTNQSSASQLFYTYIGFRGGLPEVTHL